MLRATCATHLTWAGTAPATMDIIFGWNDQKTKQRYIEKTAVRAMREKKRVRGQDIANHYELRESPPTYSDLRPDDPAELIEVDTWTPKTSVNTSPRYRGDEEWMQEELDDYNGYGPVSASAIAYWNGIGRVVDWTATRACSVWDQHVGFDFQAWLQEGTVRRVCAFALLMTLAIGTLTIPMIQMGVYIDPSTWTVAASHDGVLALITASAMYVGTSGNMWEKTLADLTEQDRLVELLTLRPGDSA